LFDLNTYMQIESEKDFPELRNQFTVWRRRFPMFAHDVRRIENIVEKHIKEYGSSLIQYRQSHNRCYIEQAQLHIDELNRIIATVEKLELMALLSRR